ncbi:MAG: FlgO family outer membrane protein [Verrucomicrobiota bacterium]|nr:FlgO family outer membrane protein [Verrucomicrobiota bacterium]
MSAEPAPDLKFEIGHVLFIDIIGYSKLLITEQSELLRKLTAVVRETEQFRSGEAEGTLVRLPTGDGMALVFRSSPEAPAECALELSKRLKTHPELQVRMGIHSGPVNEVTDVNERTNIAGAGINMAQRVMDCGEAGHILVSKRVADDLEQYPRWRAHLHELGQCEVKHDVRISVVNLFTDELGNPAIPRKFREAKGDLQKPMPVSFPARKQAGLPLAMIAAALLVLGAVGFLLLRHRAIPSAGSSSPSPAPAAAVAPVAEKSIAVLPFENLSKDEENAFFADGVQDQILTNLAKLADLKVISRTSVMQYKNTATRNLREIAQQLSVAHVLEGSVQRAGGKVRVTAQLINAVSDTHEWAENYDRPVDDVFAIQSEIAKKIADQLHATISPREKAAIAAVPTTDLSANALYVRATALEKEGADERANLLEGVRLLEQAVAHDPQFLLAYCVQARMHLILFWGGYDHTPARLELANAAIQNALRLQPDAGEVHLTLARYAYYGFRDYDRARAELDLARATLPNNVDVFYLTALVDRRQSRWAEAIRNFERATALDPRNANVVAEAGVTYQMLRRYAEAGQLFQRILAISPDDNNARIVLGFLPFLERADVGPAHAALTAIMAQQPDAAEYSDSLFRCAILERDAAAANRALALMPEKGVLWAANVIHPREWFAGIAARTFNNPAAARVHFTAAREIVEKIVRDQPDYAAVWSLLGRIDADLGRKEEALREGRRACELLPPSKDAAVGTTLIVNLAVIYASSGEKDLATETLATAAKLPIGPAYGELKLNPQWDPLRGDPRFEKIVAALAPKDDSAQPQ